MVSYQNLDCHDCRDCNYLKASMPYWEARNGWLNISGLLMGVGTIYFSATRFMDTLPWFYWIFVTISFGVAIFFVAYTGQFLSEFYRRNIRGERLFLSLDNNKSLHTHRAEHRFDQKNWEQSACLFCDSPIGDRTNVIQRTHYNSLLYIRLGWFPTVRLYGHMAPSWGVLLEKSGWDLFHLTISDNDHPYNAWKVLIARIQTEPRPRGIILETSTLTAMLHLLSTECLLPVSKMTSFLNQEDQDKQGNSVAGKVG